MTRLLWDQFGQRLWETGTDRGVLYLPTNGLYNQGVAWNGLTSVTQAPSGAEPTPVYADNTKYANVLSREELTATIEALTYPSEWAECDGSKAIAPGVVVGQQNRRTFGLSYRTLVANDDKGYDFGYRIHMIYGALAAPTEKAHNTVNDTPEPTNLSWELSTTPVDVPGAKPSAIATVTSFEVPAASLQALEDILYGTAGTNPRMPLPSELIGLFTTALTAIDAPVPTFTPAGGTITLPTTTGVTWTVDGITRTGTYTIPTVGTSAVVQPKANAGYRFNTPYDDDFVFKRTS